MLPRRCSNFFLNKLQRPEKLGINDIIIDPGFGFSKTRSQSFELLQHLELFQHLELPLFGGHFQKIHDLQNPQNYASGSAERHHSPSQRSTFKGRIHFTRTRCKGGCGVCFVNLKT